MVNKQDSIISMSENLSEKQQVQLKPKSLASLNKKLLDISNEEIEKLFLKTFDLLKHISSGNTDLIKDYKTSFRLLKKTVRDTYGYIESGTLQSEFMAMGIAFGLVFGSIFAYIVNMAMIGIGLPIGLAIGLSIGKAREDKAEEEGKLY